MPQKQRLGTKHPSTGCERAPNAEAAPRPHLGSNHTQRYALRLRSSKGRILTIGIAAALDPVALDKACVDLVYQAPDGASLVERIESRRGIHILDHAQQLGLGHKNYQLVDLDR